MIAVCERDIGECRGSNGALESSADGGPGLCEGSEEVAVVTRRC